MAKILFELEDIKPQLTDEQIIDLKHEIKLAKRDNKTQYLQFGEFGRKIIILTSGKLIFIPEDVQKVCGNCRQILKE